MSCTKTPYPTPTAARQAVIALRQGAHGWLKLRGIHPCAVHHAWHITSHWVKKEWRVS